jgi:hypothetical protein
MTPDSLDRRAAGQPDATGGRWAIWSTLAILTAVAIVYREAFSIYFFEDDFQWLVSTWTYRPASLIEFGQHSHFYRPVIELYFWMATPLFQGSPVLFHAANVALHAMNGLAFFALVRLLARDGRQALVAALVFVVVPGYVHAIVWVSALAEAVGAFFACIALYGFMRAGSGGGAAAIQPTARRAWRGASIIAYGLALLTHESSVVILALMAVLDWMTAGEGRPPLAPATVIGRLPATLRMLLPYVALTIVYLAIDLPINSRSYVVGEGHYRLGFHAVRNVLGYIVSLYVGKRGWIEYALVSVALAWILFRGTGLAVFGAFWMVVALLPFAFFTWGSTSRYLYLPAMGFALLLSEGIAWLDRALARRVAPRVRVPVIALLVLLVTVRFMVFASKGVGDFSAMAEKYRTFLTTFREQHPQVERGAQVRIDPNDEAALGSRYLQSLLQWEYRDPTMTFVR